MSGAKIRLSQKEMELMASADFILTKNAVINKVRQLLAAIQHQQQELIEQHRERLPAVITNSSPKISRGEQYLGLPYLILDQPRIFEQQNIFAIRTMFWWGKHFSVTLHLSGVYKTNYEQKISASFEQLKQYGYFICINEDPWDHHFEETNYRALSTLNKSGFDEIAASKSFIKIASRIPLEQWDDATNLLSAYFNQLLKILLD